MRSALLILLVLAIAGAGLVWSGLYDVAADRPHSRPVQALLTALRERSIAARAGELQVPDLSDAELIRQGAGNYDAMCSSCHLAPGMSETELSKGLYPAPPRLADTGSTSPARAFWVIKHGIKASGMPAWGKSMADEYVWGMGAFLRLMPTLDAEGYRGLVASSSGHSHGGGAATPADAVTHQHADGRVHVLEP